MEVGLALLMTGLTHPLHFHRPSGNLLALIVGPLHRYYQLHWGADTNYPGHPKSSSLFMEMLFL